MDPTALASAEALLGCARGVSRGEVMHAYRRALLRGRPDLGAADGTWTVQVQAARDLLLACAPPERRGRRRGVTPPATGSWAPRRRATWGQAPASDPAVDVRL